MIVAYVIHIMYQKKKITTIYEDTIPSLFYKS